MSGPHGSFAWYELMTTDHSGAETFYKRVVGWETKDSGMPDMTYTLVLAGQTPIAGIMDLPKEACDAGAKPMWLGYIEVDDVDAAAKQVQAAGGKIYKAPDDIPGVGRFAVAADPSGAAFAMFHGSAEMHHAPAMTPEPGFVNWRELMAGDGPSAFDFYSALFGWEKGEAMDMGPMGVYQLFKPKGGADAMGGMMTKSPETPIAMWNYYLRVPVLGEAIERAKAGGGTIINGPMEVPGNEWIAQGFDPQGAMFSLISSKA